MASNKPASVKQVDSAAPEDFEESLLSMENLDRTSPELWPEKSMSEYRNTLISSTVTKLPYSREITADDQNYLHSLASLSTPGLIMKVKELHDIAYKLGVEESKEMTRGKYLDIFGKSKKNK